VAAYKAAGLSLPKNAGGKDLLLRRLDRAVIQTLHEIRVSAEEAPIDTVSGVFIEGGADLQGCRFLRENAHSDLRLQSGRNQGGIPRT
jgi:hypothetical protein